MLSLGACGFDGAGALGGSVSTTEPAAPPAETGDAGPATPLVPVSEGGAGGDSAVPVAVCTDMTLSFDGADVWLATAPDDAELDLGGDFTVEAWFKPGVKTSGGTEIDIVSHHDAVETKGWVLLIEDGRVELVVYGDENSVKQGCRSTLPRSPHGASTRPAATSSRTLRRGTPARSRSTRAAPVRAASTCIADR